MDSILQTIIKERELDKINKEKNFCFTIPKKRERSITPFLPEKGVILEIKRASPSKGDIAPSLDPSTLAIEYQKAGAAAISILTENNYFKGSLQDIVEVARVLDSQKGEKPAILRKDFLTDISEIDASYKVGADAVLLIARILETERLIDMAVRCADLGLGMLIELRTDEDIGKYHDVEKALLKKGKSLDNVVAGTNTRDLATFAIDLLKPLTYGDALPKKMIFESGIHTPMGARFAGSLGFYGMLVGEAASKNPQKAHSLVDSFLAGGTKEVFLNTIKWKQYALELGVRSYNKIEKIRLSSLKPNKTLPFVKICGITNVKDALKACELGADFLGFISVKKSPRYVDKKTITAICKKVREKYSQVMCVGVITDQNSTEGQVAIGLATVGILDAVQFHNCSPSGIATQDFWHYQAVKIGSRDDIANLEKVLNFGQPRVLIDANVVGKDGGTGVQISNELVSIAQKKSPLWLAGGINPENVGSVLATFSPELIDVSSGVESSPGIKDHKKLEKLFENIRN